MLHVRSPEPGSLVPGLSRVIKLSPEPRYQLYCWQLLVLYALHSAPLLKFHVGNTQACDIRWLVCIAANASNIKGNCVFLVFFKLIYLVCKWFKLRKIIGTGPVNSLSQHNCNGCIVILWDNFDRQSQSFFSASHMLILYLTKYLVALQRGSNSIFPHWSLMRESALKILFPKSWLNILLILTV